MKEPKSLSVPLASGAAVDTIERFIHEEEPGADRSGGGGGGGGGARPGAAESATPRPRARRRPTIYIILERSFCHGRHMLTLKAQYGVGGIYGVGAHMHTMPTCETCCGRPLHRALRATHQ
ncbi:hypothetical protein EVAR_51408_1 [Eumeta japonica]|uniref:Uncharacterized protein n=1 Tax=Eumeta variegata TaxID=151549 RepID=A0A4C1XYI0_EUMVA|nr:hypothetical protein EVAR_51408_1 [Eumeta japonica]